MANRMFNSYPTSAAACGAACAAFMCTFILTVLGIAAAMPILFTLGALRLCLCAILLTAAVVRGILILHPQAQKARFG
jgi:hypothetical protein